MMSLASQKRHTLMLSSVKGTGKNQLKLGQESIWDGPLWLHCSLLRNPWPKPIVCWSIVMKMRQSTVGSPFFMMFPSDCIPKVWRMSKYIFLFTVAIPVNYTSKFQEFFEATTYVVPLQNQEYYNGTGQWTLVLRSHQYCTYHNIITTWKRENNDAL